MPRVSVLIKGAQWAAMWFPVGARVLREAACAGMLMTNAMRNTVAIGQIGKRRIVGLVLVLRVLRTGRLLPAHSAATVCLFTRLAEHLVVSGHQVCR